MAAEMWRIPSSKVVQTGRCSFVQDQGMLYRTGRASNHNFLFSEVGAGIHPMVLIGLWHEVMQFVKRYPETGIENRIPDLPAIYMGMCFYRPGQRFKGLFPLNDTLLQVTKTVPAFVPKSPFVAITNTTLKSGKGLRKWYRKKRGKSKEESRLGETSRTEIAVTFSYLPEDEMIKLGEGTVPFSEIAPKVLKGILGMAGL